MEKDLLPRFDIAAAKSIKDLNFIGNEFAIFDDIRHISTFEHPYRIEPAVIAICLSGSLHISINLKSYQIEAKHLVVLMSDHIVQYHGQSEDLKGLFIAVSEHFMNEVLPKLESILPIFFYATKYPSTPLTDDELERMEEYYRLLKARTRLPDAPFRKEIAQNLLKVLFYEISGIFSNHQVPQDSSTRQEDICSRFLLLVSQSFKQERSISFYAKKMYISPKYLASVVKQVSAKKAAEWIDEHVILEAKALLKSTSLSIQEIAYELNFPNQSFFGKYFKQKTGMTPGRYRES